jgi:hypothetical protein
MLLRGFEVAKWYIEQTAAAEMEMEMEIMRKMKYLRRSKGIIFFQWATYRRCSRCSLSQHSEI